MKKLLFLSAVLFFISSTGLLANKTKVEVKAASEVKSGTEVTLVINVLHMGNSKGHHTDWVSLKINGVEVKKWAYDKTSLPPEGNFTLEFKTTVTGDLTIEAQGHCNIHGSAPADVVTIKVN